MRLLRSHAAGLGDPLPEEVARGTLLVRLAQMAAGAGGNRPQVADALAAVLCEGPLPRLRQLGGIGTGDLTVLAQLALALAGEADPRDPAALPRRLDIQPGDALPFMSSNAATFATAVLAWADLADLLEAGLGVAALTFCALRGNHEAFDPAVAAARPLSGLTAVAARMRLLTADAPPAARLQDPFGLRCLPPVAGALHDALSGIEDVLAIEINAGSENPLFSDGRALHHGGFHAATCALALDGVRLALVPFASLSAARLTHLMAPELSGLTPFLAVDEPGASGVLIAEYLAADALARLRAEAVPAVLGSASISRGLEEHASFAWQAAWQARRAVTHVRTVIALEWVVAERALRMRAVAPDGVTGPARVLAGDFGARLEDRPIGEDVAHAARTLPALAEFVRGACA
jgi:histidine ammonia-lyase